jgi:hypothetical protein
VSQETSDFTIEHANELSAARDFGPQKFLGCQDEGVLLIHRRDVIEPIEVSNRLQISLVLDEFFGPAMEQSNVRVDALNNLAIEFQNQAQNAMRRRVLRPKIYGEVPA